VCKISAQYVHFYLGFYASQKNNFSADAYVHLAVNGLKGSTNGVECVIGAVYGPNNNDPVFFDELERDLVQLSNNGQIKTIVGGDWNATWDIRDSQNNIDVINMVTILSKYRSKKISNIAKTMKLTEPFRFLHPVLKEFTYVPSARNNLNRSEIRFLSSIRIVT
jgi:exonuclease III